MFCRQRIRLCHHYRFRRPTDFQLPSYGKSQLLDGQISRWRIQAAQVAITPEGWTSDRMGFTNDPYTPAQTRIDTENVVAKEQPNGDILIKSSRMIANPWEPDRLLHPSGRLKITLLFCDRYRIAIGADSRQHQRQNLRASAAAPAKQTMGEALRLSQ